MQTVVYKRVLLKISGEALGRDFSQINNIAQAVKSAQALGVEIAIVVGGGNIFRGRELKNKNIGNIAADNIGMLATVINAIAMQEIFEQQGISCRLMSALPVYGLVREFDRAKALRSLKKGHVVIFAGGTGNPLVSTDSAASLRAVQIDADVILKATNVDGIYSADPKQNVAAIKYDVINYREAIEKELDVMDLTAFMQCKEHGIPIVVFKFEEINKLLNIVKGEKIGTLVRDK